MLPESDITPATDLPRLEELAGSVTPKPELLGQCVMLKLNGGLGTSMGLDQAKSLLKVRLRVTLGLNLECQSMARQ